FPPSMPTTPPPPTLTLLPYTTLFRSLKASLTVKIILRSFDVNHAFWLVPFDLKIDVIPGHTNTYWLQPLQPGDYAIRCAEYCGLDRKSTRLNSSHQIISYAVFCLKTK